MPCQGVFWKFPKSSDSAEKATMFMARRRRNGLMRMVVMSMEMKGLRQRRGEAPWMVWNDWFGII
jgi:hypothetical protein